MDKQTILNGTPFALDEENGVKFLIEYRNWNDYGYYTLYSIQMYQTDTKYPYRIAYLNVMNVGQKLGKDPDITAETYVFISDPESAEKLFLYLTPAQRLKLEELLSICYDCRNVENEEVFKKSILRGKTKAEFIQQQEKIKNLMHSKIDARSFLIRNKYQLQSWLDEVKE